MNASRGDGEALRGRVKNRKRDSSFFSLDEETRFESSDWRVLLNGVTRCQTRSQELWLWDGLFQPAEAVMMVAEHC